MQINNSFIVEVNGKFQIIYVTHEGYFITSNGAFNQRETSIERITKEEAMKQEKEIFKIPVKKDTRKFMSSGMMSQINKMGKVDLYDNGNKIGSQG